MPKWWIDGWASRTPAALCATGECAAGLLPAKSEMRSTDQIDKDLNRRICEASCELALPITATALPKSACEIPKRAAQYVGKEFVSGGFCSTICR